MKATKSRAMKHILFAMAITFSTALFQCSSSEKKKVENKAEEVKDDLMAEKEKLAKDLREVRDDIDRKLERLKGQIAKANSESKRELESTRTTLLKERQKVDKALEDVEKTSKEFWVDTKAKADRTLPM